MRSRTAIILAVLAVLAVVAAALVGGPASAPQTEVAAGTVMFPGLAGKLAGATRIEITAAGKTLVLARRGDVWGLPDHDNYPIEPDKLHALLSAVAELRLAERRTADPAQFGRLGLDDAHAPGSNAILIRVLDANGAPIAEVVKGHGHTSTAPDGTQNETTYVREPGRNQTWLASGGLASPSDPLDWVARDVLSIPADAVASIHAQRDGAASIDLARGKDGKLAVISPASHPPLDPFKVDDLGRALEAVSMQDVRAAASVPGKREGQTTVTTKAGLAVTATVYRDGEAVWLTLAARGSGAEPGKLQAKVTGWAYRVAPSAETSLLPTLQGLAAYVPPSPAAASPAGAPAGAPALPLTGLPAPAKP